MAGSRLLHQLEGSYTLSVETIPIKRYQRHHGLLYMQCFVFTWQCSDLCYVYCQVRKLSSQVPRAFLGPIFSHLLVSYIASTTQEKLNELLLLPEGVRQWLISYGRQKQQHLRGQWLPVELGLSLLAHGILFEGKRRKSIVKLPIHSAITTHQQRQHKSYHLIQAKHTGGMFSALLSVRLRWNRNISQGKPTQH